MRIRIFSDCGCSLCGLIGLLRMSSRLELTQVYLISRVIGFSKDIVTDSLRASGVIGFYLF